MKPIVIVIFLFMMGVTGSVSGLPPFNPMEVSPGDSAGISGHKQQDTILQYNKAGSYGHFLNGIRARIRMDKYLVSADYSYRNFDGYRAHSNEYAHNFDLLLETTPSDHSKLQITGNYMHGREKRPGSLTKSEFEQDPFQADQRAVNRDETRMTTMGQVRINFSTAFGPALNQNIEISGTGRIENFLRSTEEFKIINRYALGLQASYSVTHHLWTRTNEFSIGGNLFTQPERKEEYENFSGQKSDQLEQLKSEKTGNSGCYASDNFELVREKLFLRLNGKYENVVYHLKEETLPSLSDTKRFHALTPEIGLKYNITKEITISGAYGMSLKYPTVKELESPDPSHLYNQALLAQRAKIFNAGINGKWTRKDSSLFFMTFQFHALFFSSNISQELVPYEIYGEEYFRNAGRTNRYGMNSGVKLGIYTGLDISADYTYSHFIYATYTANSLETDSTGNIVSIYRDFAGNFEPNIPENYLNVSLAYEHPLGGKAGIHARVSYIYADGLWVDDANTGKTGSYNLLNSEVGFDLKFTRFLVSASAGVFNVFDQIYVGYANVNSADKRFYDAGAPRNFFGSVNFAYVF